MVGGRGALGWRVPVHGASRGGRRTLTALRWPGCWLKAGGRPYRPTGEERRTDGSRLLAQAMCARTAVEIRARFVYTAAMQRLPAKSETPVDQRPENPRPMHFTQRDSRILEAIHAFDGMMGQYQLQRLFFTGQRQCRGRLSVLFQHGYLARPNRRRRASLPCMIYWLDRRGAAHVAGLSGQNLAGFRYRREPRWSQVEHDLAVNDFRLDVMKACARRSDFTLEEWVPEGEFLAQPDRVTYTRPNGKTAKRLVRPDGFFVVRRGTYHSRLLLELDRATEDNPRFARQKVLPGVAYLRSAAYKKRFGYQSGRWLVVTTTGRRLRNMKRQTEVAAGKHARVFYFATFDHIQAKTVLTAPVWWRGGEETPISLFQST